MATPLTFVHFTNKCGVSIFLSIPNDILGFASKTPIKTYTYQALICYDGILPAKNSMATLVILWLIRHNELMNKVFAYNPKNKPKEHFIKEQKGSEDKQKAVVVSKTGTNHSGNYLSM